MASRRLSSALVLAPLLLVGSMQLACENLLSCGYGGAGCSDPLVFGLCEGDLVVGQTYIVVYGYSSDTGVSEATVLGVDSSASETVAAALTAGDPDVPEVPDGLARGPFDLNNGPGDGGITLRALAAGRADLTVSLRGWDEPWVEPITVVALADAPEGFNDSSAEDRLTRCIYDEPSTP